VQVKIYLFSPKAIFVFIVVDKKNTGSNINRKSFLYLKVLIRNVVYSIYKHIRFSLSLYVLTAILPDEPGLASFIEAKDDGSGGDNWSYKLCIATVKSSPPTNQYPSFYRPDALPVAQPTVSKK